MTTISLANRFKSFDLYEYGKVKQMEFRSICRQLLPKGELVSDTDLNGIAG